MKIIVTGSAGFIGAAVSQRLLAQGLQVVGIDNLNDYYDVAIKKARLEKLLAQSNYQHHYLDIAERVPLQAVFEQSQAQRVIHLAAQAGVRYASINPQAYINSNLVGFANILESCRALKVEHLVYASTSSVYGANSSLPFNEAQATEHPLTLYAASKKANELMAHSYAHLYGFACTGLRFFTVYGPWGRPDMALFKFARAILRGEPIELYNHGQHSRSFTYIDDIAEGVVRICAQPASVNENWLASKPDPGSSGVAKHRIYNIGSETSVPLLRYVELLEQCLGRSAKKNLLPLQAGDVPETAAEVERLFAAVGYKPEVDVATGIQRFVQWYLAHLDLLDPDLPELKK